VLIICALHDPALFGKSTLFGLSFRFPFAGLVSDVVALLEVGKELILSDANLYVLGTHARPGDPSFVLSKLFVCVLTCSGAGSDHAVLARPCEEGDHADPYMVDTVQFEVLLAFWDCRITAQCCFHVGYRGSSFPSSP